MRPCSHERFPKRAVRAERQRRRLTQESLAEFLGVTPRYLGGLERGERNLTLDSIEALAEQLDIDPLQLLVGPAAARRIQARRVQLRSRS